MKKHFDKELFLEIGKRIKEARNAAGVTQEYLAEQIDVSAQFISDLERGVVGTSVSTIIDICKALHASSDFILMGRTDPPEEHPINPGISYLTAEEKDLVERGVQLLMEAFTYNSK